MKSQYAIGLSGQAISVYKLLLNGEPLSASDIEVNLKITRQNVYRLTEHLISNGLIDKTVGYPVKYIARSVNDARNNYLAEQGSWFSSLFNNNGLIKNITQNVKDEKPFNMTFFQIRDELLEQNIRDVNNAKISAKYIITVNPNGIPNELMLAYKSAVERGIDLKICAQEYNKENEHRFAGFKHIGVDLRHGKYMGWHIYLIDDDISYISMFEPQNKVLQNGVRLVHKGINRELQGIFEKYWREAVSV